jgi:hypothetical protein
LAWREEDLEPKNQKSKIIITMAKNKMDRITIVSALILLVPCLLQQPNTLTEAFSPYQCFIIHNRSSALTKESFHRRVEGSLAAATKDDDDGKKQNQRRPWDILRFISQSSKFIRPPSLPQIIIGAVAGGAGKNARKIGPGTYYFCTAHSNALPYLFLVNNNLLPLMLVLLSFASALFDTSGEMLWSPSSSNNFFNFSPLDDVVMGGASSSSMDNTSGIWRGVVTDANNGGFVGIRSTPFRNGLSLDMSDCTGVLLTVGSANKEEEGSGRRYKFVVRDSTDFNGICWTTEFDILPSNNIKNNKGGTTEIRIPFTQQVPTIFAKTIRGQQFDDTNVVGFQVAYSKFEYDGRLNALFQLGEFELQLLELKSY